MDIEEVKQLRTDLESECLKRMRDFERRTGTQIAGISLDGVREENGGQQLINVEVKVTL